MKNHIIYALKRPSGVFYIGASQNIALRIKDHRKRFSDFDWTILEVCGPQWRDREHFWIERYRARNAILENKTIGRNGGECLSPETRAKLSAAKKGVAKPAGFGAKVSATQKGQPKNWTPEGLERREKGQFKPGSTLGAATRFTPGNFGNGQGFRDPNNMTPEARSERQKKAAATRRLRISQMSPEEQAAVMAKRREIAAMGGKATKGRTMPPETRAKIAAAKLGKKRPRH